MPRRKEKKYHILYKTRNDITNKFYIGIHSTSNLNDGYLGSGKIIRYSIKKYGEENHSIKILEFLNSRKELLEKESKIINNELLKDPLCMNLQLGGNNGWGLINSDSEIQKIKSIKGNKKKTWLLENDKEWTNNYKKKVSKGVKESLKKYNRWEGKHHSEKTISKMKESHRGKHEMNKNRRWISNGNEIKMISILELDEYINNGWKRGRFKI